MIRKAAALFAAGFVLTLSACPSFAASGGNTPAASEAPDMETAAGTEASGTPEPSAKAEKESEPEEGGPSSAVPAGTGTAILVGAGAYTYVRTKRKEKKEEQETQKYEYFENHTQNGTLREEDKQYLG